MRNTWRVLVFDVAAPLATIAALVLIGMFLAWPVWWVAACAMLCLLIVEAMAVNYYLMRRDRVTVGTDDDGPVLRLAVVGLTTAALVAATVVGYTHWTVPDNALGTDSEEVVRLATAVSEATATFSPQDPTSSIDRAAALMAPSRPMRSSRTSARPPRTWPAATSQRRLRRSPPAWKPSVHPPPA